MVTAKNPTTEAVGLRTVRVNKSTYERRSAERYETRYESPAKGVQRAAVADWLARHHQPGGRMRILSLPDRYWTFENLMGQRPRTSFIGLQRDWRTLELSTPWMPSSRDHPSWLEENRLRHFWMEAATGQIQGYRRGNNFIFHMWAGHLLSWDNLGRRGDQAVGFRSNSKQYRNVTAAWLDFTSYLTEEVVAATDGVTMMLGGNGQVTFPVVTSFLAARDGFRDHEERVASLLIGIQKSQWRRGWRFRFDRFEVHVGTSPFISVFGDYHFVE